MIIVILCDQTDCIHCKGGHTAHDHTWENRCKNPDGVIISTRKGCQSKDIFGNPKLGIDTTTRENIQELLNKH